MLCRQAASAALAWLLLAAMAQAQDVTAARPYKGVFGGAAPAPGVTHSLDLSLSLAAVHEDNGGSGAADVSRFEQTGAYQSMTAGLAYSWLGNGRQIGGSLGTDARYYDSDGTLLSVNRYAGLGASLALGRRARVSGNQTVSCAPLHFQGLVGAAAAVPLGEVMTGSGLSLSDERACVYDSSGSFGYSLSRRSQVEALASWRYAAFDASSGRQSLPGSSVGARYLHTLTRRARLRLGYVRRTVDYTQNSTGGQAIVHDLDVGVDYDRGLSLTRRTYLDFTGGSTIVTMPPTGAFDQRLEYRLVGNAGLNHQIGRTWRARVGYARGVGFVEGLTAPVLTDSVTTTVNGFLTRRIDVSANAGVTSGAIQESTANDVSLRTATATVRMALSRSLALSGQYTYYSHALPGDALVYQVDSSLRRHAAQVGITWWLPIVRH